MSKLDELKIKHHYTKSKKSIEKAMEKEKKEVQLEILVEELRKTVCILGSIIQVQNASIKDENFKIALENKLSELYKLRSMGKLKEYYGV